jgi:arylsulfatase A-like enzyme
MKNGRWILAALACALAAAAPPPPAPGPNIVFILADDLGRGDLGCYGQAKIRTPHLDRMAAEGLRFTQAYTGTSVCAPARCSLMTGLHMGHAPIRANREVQPEGQRPLPEGTLTVARVLQEAGYATACVGKWGLGMFDTPGSPLKAGFDHFFGYNCQRHAHSYYPKYLYRGAERVELDGKTYAQDLIAEDVLGWVRRTAARPFFLYYAITLPHARFEIPSVEPYDAEPWTDAARKYAAMVSRLDRDVGRLISLLGELGLDGKTVVFFASDNGADNPAREFFRSNGDLRGIKRTMYEGGIRVPMIVRWPGTVPAGKASDVPWAFWDFLPTAAELAGAKLPADAKIDGLSVVSALRGGEGPKRDCFYWELHEGKFIQALRLGNWKAVRSGPGAPLELYDLEADPSERNDLAAGNPEVIARAEALLKESRVDSPDWPARAGPARKKP